MFGRWQRNREETADINVIPVMNLFMVLIPFLLMGAAFFHISVIPVSTPTHNPSESDIPKTPTTVSCNLAITPDKVRLTASSVSLNEEELEALSGEWPVSGGKIPVEGVQNHLIGLKKSYPGSTTIIVLPHDEVPYQELVGLLDAIRERKTGKLDKDGEPVFAELFPVTVFSRFVPPPPEGESAEEGEDGGEEGGGGEEEGGEEEGGE